MLTAALPGSIDRATSCGITIWPGRRRAIRPNCTTVIRGISSAPTGARGTWSFPNCASANWPKLLHIPIESIAVVPNGIDQAAFFKLSPITLALLQRIDLTQAAPILLLPVRLTPRKNIELALRTLAALRRDDAGRDLDRDRTAGRAQSGQ